MSQKFIHGLRNELTPPKPTYRIYANAADGEGAVLTYSFDTADIWGNQPGFHAFSSAEKTKIKALLASISAVTNVKFIESSPSEANFFYTRYALPPGVTGMANFMYYDLERGAPNPDHYKLRVVLDSDLHLLTNRDDQGTVLHETLHILGLEHPHERHYRLPSVEDRRSITIMSYKFDKPGINTLGVLDIAALQSIYGPAYKKMGTNTYIFGKDKVIWDGGGTDTITASGASQKVLIDLNDGSWNYIGAKASSITAKNQVYIGEHTIIERAYGSSYNDRLLGNEVNNGLRGRSGNDILNGRSGNDTVAGDAGDDRLYGSTGSDKLLGGSGKDLLQGGTGADLLYGGSDNDRFYFQSYAEMGSLNAHDRIRDFKSGDKIDFSKLDGNVEAAGRQKLIFLGNGHDDSKLSSGKAGQFYFDVDQRELRFDTNGDGAADQALDVNMATMNSGHFIL